MEEMKVTITLAEYKSLMRATAEMETRLELITEYVTSETGVYVNKDELYRLLGIREVGEC